MATDYSFVENELTSVRKYQVLTEGYIELIKACLPLSQFKILDKKTTPFIEYTVEVSHLFDEPAEDSEIENVAEVYGFELPQDFIDFYKRWNGCLLFFRNPYRILSTLEIIEHTEFTHDAVGREYALPDKLLRFCDFDSNGNYFALRRKDDGMTDAVFVYGGDHEEDIVSSASNSIILADSFSEWLKRMFESDGSPILKIEKYDKSWGLTTQADRILS